MINRTVKAYSERAGQFLRKELFIRKKQASVEDRKHFRTKFASKIGVDERTLTRYCSEIHDIDTIKHIADVLGVSVIDMIADEEETMD